MVLVHVESEMAIVAACDPTVELPSGTDADELVRRLEPMALAGKVFYLVTDDPVRYRIELVAGEPASIDPELEASGGAFGLDLPTGRLALHGWTREGVPVAAGAIGCQPGQQALSVFVRRPFDSARHAQEMTSLLGDDWEHVKRVDRLSLLGCLPLVATAVLVLAQKWRWLLYALALLVLSYMPHVVLRSGRRYRDAERRQKAVEDARPHFLVRVAPTDQAGLAGGFLRV
jgi:hypothetical protein